MVLEKHLLNILFNIEEEAKIVQLSRLFPIQSIFVIRAKRRSIYLADFLLDEKGTLVIKHLEEISLLLKKNGYITYPDGIDDAEITEHFFSIVTFLKKHPRLFSQIGLPLCNREIERMIQITLNLERPLTDRDVGVAILSALLCPLRQNIGSCFATAPAILIQKEYPGQCLQDLQAMLNTGVLKRVISGVEFSVPMSPTPGPGDLKREIVIDEKIASLPALQQAFSAIGLNIQEMLTPFYGMKMSLLQMTEEILKEHFSISDEQIKIYRSSIINPHFQRADFRIVEEMLEALETVKWHFVAFTEHLLLKVWEFTLASLADVKMEFSLWNLFSSLGLHPQEKSGIGSIIYSHLEAKLNEANQKLEHFQTEYAITFDQVRATESLLRAASTEGDMRRLKMEHYSRTYQMQVALELRDKYAAEAKKIADFFPFFIEALNTFFPEYFQEIYDPDMQEIKVDPSDDSPAGFRLAYKHGRTHASNWTFIYTKEQWLRTLRDFFVAVETRIAQLIQSDKEKELVSEIITAIIQHLSEPEFLKTAFLRMAKAHHITLRKPELEDLERIEKKPWAYTSGGTIVTLLKTYFRYESNITEMTRWVENPTDLCVFLIDALKDLPPRIMNSFIKDPKKRMLMTSPTHAFSLLPGREKFLEGWEHSAFTYTWVRDEIIIPTQRFYHSLSLTSEQQQFLVEKFSKKLPLLQAHQLNSHFIPTAYSLKPSTFYRKLIDEYPFIPTLLLESFLFETLPIQTDAKNLIPFFKEWEMSKKFDFPVTRHDLHRIFVTHIMEKNQSMCFDHNIHEEVRQKMAKWGLAPPLPFIFGDSNWTELFLFAFIINPGTEEFELWRVDSQGIQGIPMKEWKMWLDGSHKTPWGVFSHPHQYAI